jgi:hypothetical protein
LFDISTPFTMERYTFDLDGVYTREATDEQMLQSRVPRVQESVIDEQSSMSPKPLCRLQASVARSARFEGDDGEETCLFLVSSFTSCAGGAAGNVCERSNNSSERYCVNT